MLWKAFLLIVTKSTVHFKHKSLCSVAFSCVPNPLLSCMLPRFMTAVQWQLGVNTKVKAESQISLKLPVWIEGRFRLQLSPVNTCWIHLKIRWGLHYLGLATWRALFIAYNKKETIDTVKLRQQSQLQNMRQPFISEREKIKINSAHFFFFHLHCNERLLCLFPARFSLSFVAFSCW